MDRVGGIHADDVAFVRVLGPIQVVTISGLALELPSASQRRSLARLACGRPAWALRVDLLCDVLAVSPGALPTIVSRLRKGFGDTIVVASQGRKNRLAAPRRRRPVRHLAVAVAVPTSTGSGCSNGRWRCGQARAFEEFSAEDVRLYQAWEPVVSELYLQYPFPKLMVPDPQHDWPAALRSIRAAIRP